jgi:hypothetical protein
MAQVSRPFQIGLAAAAVLALVWFVALHGHGAGSGGSSSPSASSQPSATATSRAAPNAGSTGAGAPSKIYHGAAPGVEGLTRDVAKAHGAVARSQRNAAELQRKSAQASGEGSRQAAARGGVSAATVAHGKSAGAAAHARGATHASSAQSAGGRSASANARPPQQAQVERELTHGKTVVLVFWNPKSSVDVAVRSQALALGSGSKGKVAVHVARANQVGLFGPVTEVAHVFQTPTVLIVSRHGLVSTLTGLTDTFALRQAVREAGRANH